MANRRKEARKRPGEGARTERRRVPHEVLAVILGCLGLLTILALLSFHPADASLNASGTAEVHNWIGPAGGYWADLLLQLLGVSAYALGLGLLLAGWRALTARHVFPGLRETAGMLLSVASVGAMAHLSTAGRPWPFAAGGVVGALLGDFLREQVARTGAFIVSSALVLLSLALLADGVLAGLGVRGAGLVRWTASLLRWTARKVRVSVAAGLEHQRRLRAERVALRAQLDAAVDEPGETWSLGELTTGNDDGAIEAARARAGEDAAREARSELEDARRRAVRPAEEPAVAIDDAIDMHAEEDFELGELPDLDPTPAAHEDVVELEDDYVDEDVPVVAAVARPKEPPPAPVEEAVAPPLAPEAPAPKRALRQSKASEPQIIDVRPDVDPAAIERAAAEKPEVAKDAKSFELPSPALLDFEAIVRPPIDPQKLRDNASRLTKTLKDYGIEGHVREIRPGPVVTMYEYVPAPGTKLSKIASLADDLAMSMEALRVRIVAPIPGKGAVGIEIPNEVRETVYLKEIVASDGFKRAKSMLTMALGKDIEGGAYVADLVRMPHLLVAGATGAGKSVSINTMIMSILFRATPDEVRMIMVDPKMLELSVYEGIPHLLLPVVTDPKKAALALRWAVEEMERRYQMLSETGVRGIDSYNKKVRDALAAGEKVTLPPKEEGEEPRVCEPLPYIVVIVDELADLMMVASRDVEASIMRLAQMARAAGIHLILATQRPSVDVITGVIKANFPTRIAFQVASRHDSRTIIDGNGAEHLLGRGDMLFLSPGAGGIVRVHGAFVSDEEINRTVAFLKQQATPQYDESILAPRAELESEAGAAPADDFEDESYRQAVAIVAETRQASISMIQRRLRIGYNRAARLVERMEAEGLVGPADGAKPRQVLMAPAA